MNILTSGYIGPPYFESTLRIIWEQYRSGDFRKVRNREFEQDEGDG
jgi:hypothetical protein